MADNLLKAPKKGILKSSSSFEKTEPYRCNSKEMKWDEMNILQTLHPADKDYGHMKIDEPKTPYANYKDPEEGNKEIVDPHSDDETDGLNADLLAKKIQLGSKSLPKALVVQEEDEDDDDMFSDETEEERAKRKLFEQKRKLHYNEFLAVKLARKLMETENGDEDEDDEDEDEDEDEDDDETTSASLYTPTSSDNHAKEHPHNDQSENSNHSINLNKTGSPNAKDTANIKGD